MQNNIDPRFPKLTDKFNARQAATMFLIAVFTPTVVSFVYSLILIGYVGSDMEIVNAFLDANAWIEWTVNALLQVAFIAVFFIYSKKQRVNMFTAAKINKKLSPVQILIVIGIAICVLFAFDPLTLLFSEFLKVLGYKSPDTPLIDINSWGTYITAFFTVCILPAIGEELIYRGALTSGLSEYGKRTAILMTGLCFSLMHQNPDQTMHQFLLGCLLAWVFLETGSFWAPAIIHFLNNFIVVSIQFYYVNSGVDLEAELAAQNTASFWSSFGSAMLIAAFAAPVLFALLQALKNQSRAAKSALSIDSKSGTDPEIKVSVFKLPFADVLSPGKQGEDERVKEVEEVVRARAEKAFDAGKAAQKKAAFGALFAGLGFCLLMWLVAFFNIQF